MLGRVTPIEKIGRILLWARNIKRRLPTFSKLYLMLVLIVEIFECPLHEVYCILLRRTPAVSSEILTLTHLSK